MSPTSLFILLSSDSRSVPDDVANKPVENLYIKKSAFQGKARNPSLFRQVRVDPELGTIVWPNGADIAPETLHGGFLERPGDRPKAASA
ncbi:MAG: DUF2442 domain-containing protein [Chloroflexi bacterium]|nr:MAG: DUF2442 domain-containing protein [Chloroflexota bacterium]